jgi:hypothetical protein
MDDVNPFLIDWSIRFLENKDIIRKEIVNIEKNKEGFDFAVYYRDKVRYFIVKLILENDIFNKIEGDQYIGFFTLNNLANIRFVVSNWKKFTDFKFLSIYFINPFSSSDKVWIICPFIHDKVCDKSSLELGLKSMAEMVEIISEEKLNKRLN